MSSRDRSNVGSSGSKSVQPSEVCQHSYPESTLTTSRIFYETDTVTCERCNDKTCIYVSFLNSPSGHFHSVRRVRDDEDTVHNRTGTHVIDEDGTQWVCEYYDASVVTLPKIEGKAQREKWERESRMASVGTDGQNRLRWRNVHQTPRM